MRDRVLTILGGTCVVTSPALFFRSCSDHCGSDGLSLFGHEITGFLGVVVRYCTGGSECTLGLGPVVLPVGLVLLGVAFVRR